VAASVSVVSTAQPTPRVGVVGAGQLAHMMGEAASAANVRLFVLATDMADSAVATCDDVLLGDATSAHDLRELASHVDVVTFDHELVDLAVLRELESEGVVLRPSSSALRFAVDKAFQRDAFREALIPVPRFLVVNNASDPALIVFLDELGNPPVVKAARGGYDGRGVAFPENRVEALARIDEMANAGKVVVEERLALRGEYAQLVARDVEGNLAFYPVVSTLQRSGMCIEVRYPSDLDEATSALASELSRDVAQLIQGVGVLAIEYFLTDRGLLINEVALRPHNTGHWTIEGVTTSQFVQHLRAVSGQSLGDTSPLATSVVMVNVVGAEQPGSLEAARAVPDVFVHDYAKSWRPGRKLGHVTALDDETTAAHVRAWRSALAYGTLVQEA
jgi:5-(carboxyamino)imidazole ribonucleotide synthase